MTEPKSRRSFLLGTGAAAAAGGVGFGAARVTADQDPSASSGHDRPRRQHAWADALELDEHGNHVMPRSMKRSAFSAANCRPRQRSSALPAPRGPSRPT